MLVPLFVECAFLHICFIPPPDTALTHAQKVPVWFHHSTEWHPETSLFFVDNSGLLELTFLLAVCRGVLVWATSVNLSLERKKFDILLLK